MKIIPKMCMGQNVYLCLPKTVKYDKKKTGLLESVIVLMKWCKHYTLFNLIN